MPSVAGWHFAPWMLHVLSIDHRSCPNPNEAQGSIQCGALYRLQPTQVGKVEFIFLPVLHPSRPFFPSRLQTIVSALPEIQWTVALEARRVVHFEQPWPEVGIDEDVESKQFEAAITLLLLVLSSSALRSPPS